MRRIHWAIAAILLFGGLIAAHPGLAQKRGGTLVISSPDSPGGMSILEEATQFAVGPMAGVFNNLIMFDQMARQNTMETIVPDLATSWSWERGWAGLDLATAPGCALA